MAFTRAAPARTTTSTSARPTGPEGVKCDGHNAPARKFQAGPTSKNPGRWFYTCALARDDPARCKFFQWAGSVAAPPTPSRGQTLGGHTLGASPGAPAPSTPSRLMRPTGSALHTPAKAHPHSPAPAVSSASRTPTHPQHPQTPSRSGREVVAVDDDEIDWASIDADGLERDAEVRATPKSQRTGSAASAPTGQGNTGAGGVQARLEAVSPLGGKRKLSDVEDGDGEDGERTPKRATGNGIPNPFLTTPSRRVGVENGTPGTPGVGGTAHPALGGVVAALAEVGDQLARQERLVRAAESMKRSMRTTIRNLQERIKQLEGELAAERAKNK